jgi:hypothetical protein
MAEGREVEAQELRGFKSNLHYAIHVAYSHLANMGNMGIARTGLSRVGHLLGLW